MPLFLLSQLNLRVDARDNKRPMLQDLRSYGDIEQDADMVWFIYRDEVYNAEAKDKSEAEIIIAKNRGGEIGTAKLSWRGEFTKFAAKAESQTKRVSDETIFMYMKIQKKPALLPILKAVSDNLDSLKNQ